MSAADWKWFGNAGHLCVSSECRFHLCTQIGGYLVSTVGEWLPGESSREIVAKSRGVTLEGRGDAREASFMRQIGYQEIGCGRKYETMVFRTDGGACGCGCGLPTVSFSEIDSDGYNDAGAATAGHMAMCAKFDAKEPA